MRALVLSDIHGNLEALTAVLAAVNALPDATDQLWNLGDIVGYGASPNEVLDLIRPLQTFVVRGNHDRVCCGLSSPLGFNPVARLAALWTRSHLSQENLAWLQSVPQGPLFPPEAGVALAHGSPLHEDHYILNMRDAWAPLQQMSTPITFFGHTHIQGGFSQQQHEWHELRPTYEAAPRSLLGNKPARRQTDAATWTIPLPPGTRHLLNPGSVGQPRDRDWRAAFAIFDSVACTITYYRVPYDLVASQGRILIAGLPERLAARLREGR